MSPQDTSRVYRVRLACDLATGLENPGAMEDREYTDGTGVHRFNPRFDSARIALAQQILNAYSLNMADVSIYMELTDYQLLRVINMTMQARADRQEVAQAEARRVREAALQRHQDRRGRRAQRPTADDGDPDEMEIPAQARLRAPVASAADLSPWGPGVANYGGSGAPGVMDEPAINVNPNTEEVEPPLRRAAKSRKTKDGRDFEFLLPAPKAKPNKPARRLVIGRKRPSVAPDE